MAQKISEQTKQAILNKTAYSLPDNPSEVGMTPTEIKQAFYKGIVDGENAITSEVNRIVDEFNTELNEKSFYPTVSETLTLLQQNWTNKEQLVSVDVSKNNINEIVVNEDSIDEWYACGVFAKTEIEKTESENYGIVFCSRVTPSSSLNFKIITYSLK